MRDGRDRANAEAYAVAASIHSGKAIRPDAFLPRRLRPIPPPPTAEDYARRAAGLREENF